MTPEAIPFKSGYSANSYWHYTWADVNGDGKADLVMTYQDPSGLVAVQFGLSNGDGNLTVTPEAIPFNSGYSATSYWHYTWADVNGDGKADLVMTYQSPSGMVAVQFGLSNGDGSLTVTPEATPFTSGYSASSYWNYTWADVNGDGKADLVMTYQSPSGMVAAQFGLSNGDGSLTVTPETTPFTSGYSATSYWHYTWADVNGDGKADLVMTYQSPSGMVAAQFGLSNGDGGLTVAPEATPFTSGYSASSYWNYSWADVNGDGKADLVMTYQDPSGLVAVQFGLSNGDGSLTVTPEAVPFKSGYSTTSYWNYTWADVNGDGKADLVMTYQDPSGMVAVQFDLTSPTPSAVQTIASGLGETTSVTYSTLSAGGAIYTKDDSAIYPTIDVEGSLHVVSRVDASNGLGGTYSATYAYAGAKLDLSGRGFLGFRQISTTDLQTNIVQTTTYGQTFPYIGLMGTTMKTLNTLTLNQATSTYQFSNASGSATLSTPTLTSAPYRVSVAQSVSSSSDLDGSKIPTATTSYQYDAYGNATQVAVSTPDGFSKTTANTYTNDTTNWFLGRLTAASVTSVAP